MSCTRWTRLGKVPRFLVWVLAVIIIILSGIGYRVVASHLKIVIANPVNLPVPLSFFPVQIGDWIGKDLLIPNTTKEYMEQNFADDFFSRRYINTTTKAWADVYVVYCSSQPGGMLGHQPRVCYPGHGWIHDSTEQSQFFSQTGRQISCLIHRFHKPAPSYDQIVVLNFYVLNGLITTNEDDFSGLFGRRFNVTGDPAKYVAQVQMSSLLENSVRTMAEAISDLILDFFPNESGKIQVTESPAPPAIF